MSRHLHRLGWAAVVLVVAVVLCGNALYAAGVVGEMDSGAQAPSDETTPDSLRPRGHVERTLQPETVERPVTTQVPGRKVTPARVIVSAPRGASYLLIRRGSASGPVLFEGILELGQSRAFRAVRLWMRAGAGAHLDVTYAGRAMNFPVGTANVILTVAGASVARE